MNNDERNDLVLGRCDDTAVWMSEPLPAPGDLNGDGSVDVTDLLILLGNWG